MDVAGGVDVEPIVGDEGPVVTVTDVAADVAGVAGVADVASASVRLVLTPSGPALFPIEDGWLTATGGVDEAAGGAEAGFDVVACFTGGEVFLIAVSTGAGAFFTGISVVAAGAAGGTVFGAVVGGGVAALIGGVSTGVAAVCVSVVAAGSC